MDGNWSIGSVAGITAFDQARLHVGHHIEHHVYLDESRLSPTERQRLREDAILSSLAYDVMSKRERAVDDPCERTFDWAFEHDLPPEKYFDDFKRPNPLPVWLSRGQGVFFITGKAGSGKSTFMRHLAGHHKTKELLQKWARADGNSLLVASHFFWCSGGHMQSSQEGLWRNILFATLKQHRQLIRPIFFHQLDNELVTLAHLRGRSWERRDLAHALSQLREHSIRQKIAICLFIDGLDEFEGDENLPVADLQQLLDSPMIKLCASSRPRNLFERVFGCEKYEWKLALHKYTRNDITELARAHLFCEEDFLLVVQNEKRREAFVSGIEERANGVFLWAVLVVREIIREMHQGGTADEMEAKLDILPTKLGGSQGLFQRIIDRADVRYQRYMARLLLVMLHASSLPLSVICWTDAYFIYEEDKDISFMNGECLQLDDKYRLHLAGSFEVKFEPAAHYTLQPNDKYGTHQGGRSETPSRSSPYCRQIFQECWSGRSDPHANGSCCRADIEALEADTQRRVRKWCPDFVDTETEDSLQFSHRSFADYLQTPEVQQKMSALAGAAYHPAQTLCRLLFAHARLSAIGYTIHRPDAEVVNLFLTAIAALDYTHRDFARSTLREFERMHSKATEHVPHFKETHWESQLFGFLPSRTFFINGGLSISFEQHDHAWFLALLANRGLTWFVREEWDRLPASERQDVGSVVLAALIVSPLFDWGPTENVHGLMKYILLSGVRANVIYNWSPQRPAERHTGEDWNRTGEELDLWQVLVRNMPHLWSKKRADWVVCILDFVETLLAVGSADVKRSLPGGYNSLFSAMKYAPDIRKKPKPELEDQWKTYGPRLQSILASRKLLTSDERKLAEQGRLIEHHSVNDAAPQFTIASPASRSTYKRFGDWARKKLQ